MRGSKLHWERALGAALASGYTQAQMYCLQAWSVNLLPGAVGAISAAEVAQGREKWIFTTAGGLVPEWPWTNAAYWPKWAARALRDPPPTLAPRARLFVR